MPRLLQVKGCGCPCCSSKTKQRCSAWVWKWPRRTFTVSIKAASKTPSCVLEEVVQEVSSPQQVFCWTITIFAAAREYINEIAGINVELLRFANSLRQFVTIYENNGQDALIQRKEQLKSVFDAFYKDYRPEVDQKVFASLMELYFSKVPGEYLSPFAIEQMNFAGKITPALPAQGLRPICRKRSAPRLFHRFKPYYRG